MHMYNEYVASTGVKDWRRTMLDEELHTSYLKQLHLPKDMDNLFESDAKEFQKMMMMYSCVKKIGPDAVLGEIKEEKFLQKY